VLHKSSPFLGGPSHVKADLPGGDSFLVVFADPEARLRHLTLLIHFVADHEANNQYGYRPLHSFNKF